MAVKEIKHKEAAREALERGVDQLANVVRVTLGPKGCHVILEKKWGSPSITTDGVTIAKDVELAEHFEDMGARLMKQVAQKTQDCAGDGTTTATVLAQSIVHEGLRNVVAGANSVKLKSGIAKAVDKVVEKLKEMSVDIKDGSQIAAVGAIAARDKVIGQRIADAMDKVGRKGVITVEEGQSLETHVDTVEGMQFDKGFVSPYLVTNKQTMEALLDNSYILLYDGKVSSVKDIVPLLEKLA